MRATLLPLFVIGLAACPGPEDGNAPTLWLAPDGSEIRVHLVENEPPPF